MRVSGQVNDDPTVPANGGRGRGRTPEQRGGHIKQVYRKLEMGSTENDSATPMDTGSAMVVFDAQAGTNKRDSRPIPPPNSEKATPDPKKKKIALLTEDLSVRSATADDSQSCR